MNSYVINNKRFIYYIITLFLSAISSWLIAAFVSTIFFTGGAEGISDFLHKTSAYLIFYSGFIGCLWYNLKHSNRNNLKEVFLSVFSAIAICLLTGVTIFILAVTLKIVIVIVVIVAGRVWIGSDRH